jgi:hypothetical protein
LYKMWDLVLTILNYPDNNVLNIPSVYVAMYLKLNVH